jgi:hypothetical protein
VVEYSRAAKTFEILKGLERKKIQFNSYDGLDHSYCDEEIDDVSEFLRLNIYF